MPDATKVIPDPAKVIPDLIRDLDLAEGLMDASAKPLQVIVRQYDVVWEPRLRFWLKCKALEMDSGSRCACPE